MKNVLFVFLVNRENPDPSSLLPCTAGRKTALFSTNFTEKLKATTKEFEGTLKVKAIVSDLFYADYKLIDENYEGFGLIRDTEAETLVVIGNGTFLACLQVKLQEWSEKTFKVRAIRQGETLLIDFLGEQPSLEFTHKLNHVVKF